MTEGVGRTYLHAKHLASRFHCTVFKGELVLPDDRPAVFVPGVCHHVEIWSPHLKFPFPVDDSGEGRTNQERPLRVTLRVEKRNSYLNNSHMKEKCFTL